MSEKIESKIRDLQERLDKIQINKATERGALYIKSQIAKLRNDLIKYSSQKSGGGGGFTVKKSGDAQVAFIGFPSVGKSSLLNLLTHGNTESRVAAYDFTTLKAIPGMMEIKQAKIQLIDLPGIILGAAAGKGRGKEILGHTRTADLILIIICYKDDGTIDFKDLEHIRKELHGANIRLNQKPARIKIKKMNKGGIGFSYNGPQKLDREDVKTIMNELGYSNASVYFSSKNVTADQLIDKVMDNRVYTPELVVINKSDLADNKLSKKEITEKIGHENWIEVSAKEKTNIKELRNRVFENLKLIRIYLKPPGEDADMEEPIILQKGATIEDLCKSLHKSFVKKYRYSMVWGESAKHPGQRFKKMDHVLKDKDIVSIYQRR